MEQPQLGEQLQLIRGKTSRAKFGEQLGLTGTQIANIEKGRKLKDGEWDKLAPVFNGAVTSSAAPADEPQAAPTSDPAPAAAPTLAPVAGPDPLLPGIPISNSELQCFKRCRRKWWLAFYRRISIRDEERTGPRSVGNRIHAGLAGWYGPEAVNPYGIVDAGIMEDLERFPEQQAELHKERELCFAMLEGFFEWLAETGADQGLLVTGTEQNVQIPLEVNGVPVVLRGRLDVRVHRERDDAILFRDWKTVGSLTEPVRTLHMDEQMLMYMLLEYLDAQATNPGARLVDGGLYTMLRRVKRTSMAKPPFYDQVEVRHNKHELQNFYVRVYGEIFQILQVRTQLDSGADHQMVAYPSPRRECTWDCDFFPVCPMFDDGSQAEAMLEQLYAPTDPYARYDDHGTTD